MQPAVVKTLNSAEGIKHFLATVPATIEQALERPPVSALIRLGAKKESLEACLGLEIAKASNMLTVGGNLREGQALEIAIQLIADYPNESLEDFCLCLRRGVKGAYRVDGKSDIFRFDILVINNWMKAYLDEKYKVLEDQLLKEKDELYKKPVQNTDWLQLWKDAIAKSDEEGGVKTMSPKRAMLSNLRALTDEEINAEGQEKPKKKAPYKDPHSPEWYDLRDRILRTASEFYKDRYSYSRMQLYPIREHQVLAESEDDAAKIYELATKQTT